jgi:AbrB family looped-hinge helix DNA binding protein
MQAVKVLAKWQITIPREIRKKMDLNVGDTLVIEAAQEELVLRKGKTVFDYVGSLPKLDMDVDQMRDKAIEEATRERK